MIDWRILWSAILLVAGNLFLVIGSLWLIVGLDPNDDSIIHTSAVRSTAMPRFIIKQRKMLRVIAVGSGLSLAGATLGLWAVATAN